MNTRCQWLLYCLCSWCQIVWRLFQLSKCFFNSLNAGELKSVCNYLVNLFIRRNIVSRSEIYIEIDYDEFQFGQLIHLYLKFIGYVWKCRVFGSGVIIFNVMAVLWRVFAVSMLQGNSTSHGSKEKQRALLRQNTFTQVTPNHFCDWYYLIFRFLLMCISEVHPCGYFHIGMK